MTSLEGEQGGMEDGVSIWGAVEKRERREGRGQQ
jgi:hypothetical protein